MPLLPIHPLPNAADRRRALAMLFAALLTAPSIGWSQAGFDLTQLMRALAGVRSGQASFVETRTVSMLDRTLTSTGRLSFEAPDSFVRETLRPTRERVAVVGNQVTMSFGQRSRTMALDSAPEAAVIIEAIRGTLTGNRDAIEKHFTATVSGSAAKWSLELVPLESKLRALVTSIQVSGRQSLVREVVVAMADGDRSVMSIEPDAPGARPAGAASAPR